MCHIITFSDIKTSPRPPFHYHQRPPTLVSTIFPQLSHNQRLVSLKHLPISRSLDLSISLQECKSTTSTVFSPSSLSSLPQPSPSPPPIPLQPPIPTPIPTTSSPEQTSNNATQSSALTMKPLAKTINTLPMPQNVDKPDYPTTASFLAVVVSVSITALIMPLIVRA